MTSLNPTTGKDDGFMNLKSPGNYQFPGVAANATRVYNQQLSHGGTLDLVEGDFTSVGGQPRQQIFMLNVATSPASVTAWTSPEWDGSQGEQLPRTTGTRMSAPRRAVLHPGRRLVAQRLDDLHRHHRLPPERLADRGQPADRPVRRGRGVPGHPGPGPS